METAGNTVSETVPCDAPLVPRFLPEFGCAASEVLDFLLDVAPYNVFKLGRQRVSNCNPDYLRNDEERLWGNFLFLPSV